MIIHIDVITGFLESGKTTFIKELLEKRIVGIFDKIVLIICEEGFTDYDEDKLKKLNVKTIKLENEFVLNNDLFDKIKKKYCPDYIIIEYNGTWNISKIIGLKTPKYYRLRNIIFLSNAENFNNQINNMTLIMQPHVLNSDIVVFNRYKKMDTEEQKKLIRTIRNINPKIEVTFLRRLRSNQVIKNHFLMPNNLYAKVNFKSDIALFIFLILCYLIYNKIQNINIYIYIQYIISIFLGILMQAIPFVLLGAFISAGIQIFVSTSWIINKISKGKWYSFIIAAFAGVFIPICDCGMVPIITGLLKKNAPLPQIITFWLSSSAVSPIVILSMLYAFPDQPYLAVIRFIAGIFIGISVGIILKLINLKTCDVIKGSGRVKNLGKDILTLKYDGLKGKIEAVFMGAKFEFFRVAEYVIVGALASSIFQTILPHAMKNIISQNLFIQFAVMIATAMLMSTCSTSNAFIGRSFSNNFSTVPVLSFIIIGPMLDLKNMIMLAETLKKSFLVLLSVFVIIQSAVVFSTLLFFL